MLSLFPDLLNFPIFAALILRIAAAFYFAFLAIRFTGTIRSMQNLSWGVRALSVSFVLCEVVVSTLLFAGLFTQGAALGGIALTHTSLILGIGRGNHPSESHAQLLLLVICISLLFLGAGPFAFDLPL